MRNSSSAFATFFASAVVGALLLCVLSATVTLVGHAQAQGGLPQPADRLEKHRQDRTGVELDGAKFDFILVGTGVAGAVLAKRLTQHAGASLLVLEAGGSDNDLNVRLPSGGFNMFKTHRDWGYTTEADEGLNGRQQMCPRGKLLGGTGSFNIQIYNRGVLPYDYDSWRDAGNPGWGYEDVLPYFKRTEQNQRLNINPLLHGFDGEWKITDQTYIFNASKLYMQARLQHGDAFEADQSAGVGHAHGVSYVQVNLAGGERHSIVDAMLTPDVLDRSNLHLRTHAHVMKVLFDDTKRAVGVMFNDTLTGRVHHVFAGSEVVLAAGAINSPQLLLLSGVGPRKQLEDLGIEVVHHLPGVGENLQDHTQVGVSVETRGLETFESIQQPGQLEQNFGLWLTQRQGPFSAALGQVQAYMKTKYAADGLPDVQSLFAPVIFVKDGQEKPGPGVQGLSQSSLLLRPESRGWVRLASNNSMDAPVIKMNSYAVEADLLRVVEGVKILRNVFAQPALAPHVVREVVPGADLQTDEQLKQYVRDYSFSGYHHTSTCKMGPSSDPMAVVDAQLQVHGVAGLRVADASIMPAIVSANPQAAVAMIGEKAAHMILEKHGLLSAPQPQQLRVGVQAEQQQVQP